MADFKLTPEYIEAHQTSIHTFDSFGRNLAYAITEIAKLSLEDSQESHKTNLNLSLTVGIKTTIQGCLELAVWTSEPMPNPHDPGDYMKKSNLGSEPGHGSVGAPGFDPRDIRGAFPFNGRFVGLIHLPGPIIKKSDDTE